MMPAKTKTLLAHLATRAFSILGAAIVASTIATIYWFGIASDRYVSEAHIIIQRTDLMSGQSMDFSSLLGVANNGNRADQLLLRDYLLSVDMLKKLDAELNLHAHYSDSKHDPLSRFWLWNDSLESFHRYYLNRVNVEFDEYAGVLLVKAQAYDPQTAWSVTNKLVQEGEHFMNDMARKLALEQLTFLEKQVAEMNQRAMRSRQAVLNFQNKKGLVSPQATAENIASIVARLEGQKSELETQRSSLQSFLVAEHPNIIQLNQKIDALNKQITLEENKLASPTGRTLNRTVDEFQRLEMEAAFAQDVYKTTLIALEKGRIEAIRTLKKVSVLQAPTKPDYAIEPRRYYNTLVFILTALILAGIAHLLAAIVRDHKD